MPIWNYAREVRGEGERRGKGERGRRGTEGREGRDAHVGLATLRLRSERACEHAAAKRGPGDRAPAECLGARTCQRHRAYKVNEGSAEREGERREARNEEEEEEEEEGADLERRQHLALLLAINERVVVLHRDEGREPVLDRVRYRRAPT